MTIEQLLKMWEEDAKINPYELGNESVRVPLLHHKYYQHFIEARLQLRKLKSDMKVLLRLKYEYYMGQLDEETLREHGWEPQPLQILRSDMNMYIDADADVVKLSLKIGYAEEKVDLLESILRTLQTRGYNIKSAIDFERFKAGAS